MKRNTRGALAIVAAFVVIIGVMVGYNADATRRERPTALLVDVTERQRTLTERYSVTGDAAGEITNDSQARLSRLVFVEIALGLLSAIAAVGMAFLLRRGALRQSGRFRSLVHNATDLITVLDEHAIALYQSPS